MGLSTDFPVPFGTTAPSVAEGVGTMWDVGIDGVGYLLSTLDQESPFDYRAYSLLSVPRQKNRLDTTDEPGEQTFEDWWSRAQHSWHGGAGQKVLDAENSSRYSFHSSFGIDIWIDGRIQLLKETKSLYSTTSDVGVVVAGDKIMYYHGDAISQLDSPEDGTPNTYNPIAYPFEGALISDGIYVYWSWSTGLYRMPIATWGTGDARINLLSPDVFNLVKGRIIAAVGPALHEIVDLSTDTDGATAFYTHLLSGWTWTSIAETGRAIYVAGYSGDRSAIYEIGYDSSDVGAGLTIGTPALVWEAPHGEVIYSIMGFLAKGLVIGTSKGVRIGLIASDTTGDFEVSPLVAETDYPVRCIAVHGDYAWFGWEKFDTTYSGLGRVHLGEYTYATDVMYAIQGQVTSLGLWEGRPVFTVNETGGSNYVIAEDDDTYMSQGWLRVGEVRFGTFETKRLAYFDARLVGDGGTLGMNYSTDDSDFVAILSDQPVGQTREPIIVSGSRFDFILYLNRDSSDSTITPILTEWRIRADALSEGRFRHVVPIMLYDSIRSLNGRRWGYAGWAMEKLLNLKEKYQNSTVFFFQPPGGNGPNMPSPVKVKLEDLQFKSYTAPRGASGPGGIALLVMKEQ